MMRREPRRQPKLFYSMIDIEERIPANHLLRQVKKTIDFEFIYSEVASTYGHNGNPSVPPSVILKMMVLLVLYNVRSERELMQTIPLRLDWLWFLGYDLDTETPHHSVLSKARNRWGAAAFRSFFERTVWHCVEAGLVDGRKIFMDASFVEADASMESLVNARSLKHRLHKSYAEFERRLEESPKPSDEPQRGYQKINGQRVSTTDPDSAIARDGRVKLGYKVHRAVDEANEVVTATRTTPADVHEGHLLPTLLDDHHANSARAAETVVADSGYGTVENLLLCRDRGVRGHIPELGKAAQKRNAVRGIFGEKRFRYDRSRDLYLCPAGQELKPRGRDLINDHLVYGASKVACAGCELRGQCTRNKDGRTLRRHQRQDDLDYMHQARRSIRGRGDLRRRQHLMERCFAKSKRFGYDRARWRRLWRVQIQEYLVCAIVNIQILLRKAFGPPRAKAGQAIPLGRPAGSILRRFRGWFVVRVTSIHPAIVPGAMTRTVATAPISPS